VPLENRYVLEVNCGRGAGSAWCVRNLAPHSYIGTDPCQQIIELCRRLYSMTPRLSFLVADATKHLPFQDESVDVVLCIESTHAYGGPEAVKRFASEVARVLRPNGYFLWCDLCRIDGSDASVDYLISNGELIVEEKINITNNVLHALDIQSRSRADFIERYIPPAEQEHFRLFAGLPGTQIYEEMRQGHIEYWRAVLQKKTTTANMAVM
jgi:ubiquinone/menaquinone biosynthesis C-methylase UbiE